MRHRAAIAVLAVACGTCAATPNLLGRDRILVSDRSTGRVSSYSLSGELMASIEVPPPPGTNASTRQNRDLVVGRDGSIHVVNGVFDDIALASYDGQWRQTGFDGWFIGNNAKNGVISADRAGALYASSRNGYYRIDPSTDTAVNLAASSFSTNTISGLEIGLNGLLYTYSGAISGAGADYRVRDPETGRTVGGGRLLDLFNIDSIAADAAGNVFVSHGDHIFKFSPQNELLATFAGNWDDISIAPDGTLIGVNNSTSTVLITDTNFSTFTTFDIGFSFSNAFVSFGYFVPSPGPLVLAALAGVAATRRRR